MWLSNPEYNSRYSCTRRGVKLEGFCSWKLKSSLKQEMDLLALLQNSIKAKINNSITLFFRENTEYAGGLLSFALSGKETGRHCLPLLSPWMDTLIQISASLSRVQINYPKELYDKKRKNEPTPQRWRLSPGERITFFEELVFSFWYFEWSCCIGNVEAFYRTKEDAA